MAEQPSNVTDDRAGGRPSGIAQDMAYEDGAKLQPARTQLVSNVRLGPNARANPGPLGMFGFAFTTICLGFYICGVGLPGANPRGNVGPYQVLFGAAIFVGGLNQLICACFEWAAGNTFGYAVHGMYGAFWLAFAMFQIPALQIQGAYHGDERAYTVALGIWFMAWALITLIFLIGCLKTNLVAVILFVFLTLAFFFVSVSSFVQATHLKISEKLLQTGGAFTIFSAVMAFWAGAHGLYEKDKTWVQAPVFAISRPRMADEETSLTNGHQTNGNHEKNKRWKFGRKH